MEFKYNIGERWPCEPVMSMHCVYEYDQQQIEMGAGEQIDKVKMRE